MAIASPPELLVLHAVRLKGMADVDAVFRRFSLDRDLVEGLLSSYEARGWVQKVGFADVVGWSLTDEGRVENNHRLAAELAETGVRHSIAASHAIFLGLNQRFLPTITSWQIRPTRWDPMAANDHSDWRWDERVLEDLASLLESLGPVCETLADARARFDGYTDRFAAALDRADHGERAWVDQPGVDSCHMVWFELHEDLLATLGIERGQES
ncbi:MAG: transcriptional regulator [Acidimicrobiia bacterium]